MKGHIQHPTANARTEQRFAMWLGDVAMYSIMKKGCVIDTGAPYWRKCFNDGMSPERAFRESFTEQDGL